MADEIFAISVASNGDLLVNGQRLGTNLSRKEEQVLRAIMSRNGVVSRDALMDSVYEGRDEPDWRVIDVFITKIRGKLGIYRGAIRTVWGRGFERGEGFRLEGDGDGEIAIPVSARLMDELVFITSEKPAALVERLLIEEKQRRWAA